MKGLCRTALFVFFMILMNIYFTQVTATPVEGDAKTTPAGGDVKTTPVGADVKTTTPVGGDAKTTPPVGGDAKTTLGGGNAKTTPGGGDAKTTPGGGDAKTTPGGGDAKTTPGGGDAKTTPGGGDAKTTPGGGDAKTTSGGGDAKTTPGGGDRVSTKTTPGTGVTKARPTSYPSNEPNWGKSNISIPLTIFVKSTYSSDLNNRTSHLYQTYYNAFTKTLTSLYCNTTVGFQGVNITGFFNGSIGCRFVVIVASRNSTPINTTQLRNSIEAVSYTNAKFHVKGNLPLPIETNKTKNAIQEALKQNHFEEILQKSCMETNVCRYDTVCVVNKQRFICTHKCNANNICSRNGECYVDTDGKVECRCKKDSTYVYTGHTCNDKVLVFFSGKNTTIIGACAGAVIAFLLLLLIYLGARWRHKRMSKSPDIQSEKLSDPEEIRRDNLQIENVPMNGFGKTNPMFRPDNSGHHDEGHDYTNPGNRTNRDNVYEDELAYTEGRYYRVLKDPESRSKAYVYQPSNMSIPEQRTSTASKFDELDYKPLSHHLRPEKEQQSFHDMVDTEQPYSIRRPQIMRTTVNANGYR